MLQYNSQSFLLQVHKEQTMNKTTREAEEKCLDTLVMLALLPDEKKIAQENLRLLGFPVILLSII